MFRARRRVSSREDVPRGTLAKFSVSALMFDYILTDDQWRRGRPVSRGIDKDLLQYFHVSGPLSSGTASFIAASLPSSSPSILVADTKGLPIQRKSLHIMKLSRDGSMLIAWCIYTVAVAAIPALPPWPTRNLRLTSSASAGSHSSFHMFGS